MRDSISSAQIEQKKMNMVRSTRESEAAAQASSGSYASVLNQIEATRRIQFNKNDSQERLRTSQANAITLNQMLSDRKRKLMGGMGLN